MLSSFRSIIEELEKNPPILYSSNQSKSKSGTDELAKAVSAGVGADLVVKGTSEVIGNLAKTEMGKALAKTAAGKALGSIAGSLVPVIGPVITVVSTLDLLGKILGDNGKEREALEEQVARKNELQRRQMEAEAQARQELQQKCHYLAEDLSDQLSLNMEHIISDIFQQYEQPCKDEIKKNNNAFHEHMKDLVSLRDIYQSYEKIRLELGA